MSILKIPLIIFLTNFLHVSSGTVACAMVFIGVASFIGFLALTVTDEETQKGLFAPVVSSISFLCGLVTVFVLPPVIWQVGVLIVCLVVNIGVTLRWFYKNNFQKIAEPSSIDGETKSEELNPKPIAGEESVRHQKPTVNVTIDEKLLVITEERSDVPLEVGVH